jgi:hypothetical protein
VPGQYLAPTGEFIFPEGTQPGDPLVPNNFECLDFLVRGWTPATPNTQTVGQVRPWPGGLSSTPGAGDGALAPASVRCSP